MNEQVAALRGEVKAMQLALREHYERTGDGLALLHTRSKQVDEVLVKLWKSLDFPASLALAAVGGYGRGELYPASDIDLLILLPQAPSVALQEKLERLVSHFWDIGLEIGHSVRTIQECLSEAGNDISVQTALLEARLITGNEKLFVTFEKRLHGNLDPLVFFEAKRLEQQERYMRYNETPYSLEPNFKEAPGGLRDLQVIFWIAKAAGFGSTWTDIVKNGFLTQEGLNLAEDCETFLRHLRIRMHFLLGRREDRLMFDYQNTLASQYGFESTPETRASEQLMQGYYRNAKAITLLNTILMQNLGAALSPESEQLPQAIDDDFQSVGNLLDLRDEKLFEQKPAAIFDTFLVMQENHELQGMTARTLRALWRSRQFITPEFRADPANRAAFIKLFQSERGVLHEFRRMNQLDVLGTYLPAFGRIVGQMQHDLFHVYTVDQHTLQVFRNIRRFTMSEFAHEYPLCTRAISDFDKPWLLYVAAIFHDIAKGRGGGHSLRRCFLSLAHHGRLAAGHLGGAARAGVCHGVWLFCQLVAFAVVQRYQPHGGIERAQRGGGFAEFFHHAVWRGRRPAGDGRGQRLADPGVWHAGAALVAGVRDAADGAHGLAAGHGAEPLPHAAGTDGAARRARCLSASAPDAPPPIF